MPSDIMDQRNMSSFYSRPSENRFPSERSVGFWKNGSVSDHRGLEAMPFMSGGKIISSQLEKLCQTGGNFVDNLELSHNAFKDQKRNISFEHHLMGTESTANYWKANGQDVTSLAKIYGQPALQSAEPDNGALNEGHYENGLFSSSLSDILNKRLRLALKDSFVGQSTDATRSNMVEDESFESLEEMEAQAIGDLLPDDDDLLSGAHDLGYFARTNRTDAEDDLFCSLGGMELESDEFSSKKASHNLTVNGQRGLDKLPSSELPCGEHPSRTLFVKNIDGIDDMELRVIFEQFGEIQKLFTTCRRRGFIIVSYYDIRAAQNAIRVLQTKSIRHPKLDIHFCVTSDNLSENDINLGALVVTNLDSSISNDDLLHIFSAYGQIKEICGIPNKPHLKVIEFYDVQAAETALLDLNRHGAALNRIKVEPCCPGDASSIRQVGLDLEDEQSNGCRQQNYSQMPSETFVPSGLITLGTNTTSGLHNGAMLGMHSALDLPNGSSMKSKFHGISSGSMPQSLSSPARFAMMGSHNVQSGDNELSYSLGQRNLGFQSMQTFPEFHHDGGLISGMPYHSPSTMSAMPMSINSSLTSGVDNRNIHRVGSTTHSSHTFDQNEAAYSVLGNGSGSLNGHEYIWNNSTTAHCHHHRPGWQNLPPFMNSSMSPQATQVHGFTGGPSHIPNTVLNLQQHAGSAPAVDPSLFYGRHTFSGDGGASFHPSSLGTIGYSSCSPVHALELASHNLYRHAAGNYIDPSITSPHVGIPSPQQRSHMFRGRNSATSMLASHETPNDRTRSRRHDPSVVNQADNRKQYELDVDRIIRGEDSRTTLMVKNIPNKYTSKMLMATIDEQHKGTYDFIYLPIDFKNKCNVGYAFINVTDPQHIIPFYQSFNGKKWEKFNSEKVASLAYARIQGKAALVAHFQNSSLMNEDKRCRPILFHSDGPNAGDQEPFPMGVNIRSRRSRTSTENHQGSPSSSSSEESSNAVGSPSGCPPRILIEHASFSKAI